MPSAVIETLFRGESLSPQRPDQERVQWVKRFHLAGQGLWTKLAHAGNPYALAQLGLVEAVGKHIAAPHTFEKTHFLSFTSDEAVALRYARDPAPEDPDDIDKASRSDEPWSYTKYAVFSLRISAREPIAAGLYLHRYNSGANVAVLVKGDEYLQALPTSLRKTEAFRLATAYSTDDNEWLVLPADPLNDGTLSACLRKGSDLEVDHYVESAFFIDGESAFLP